MTTRSSRQTSRPDIRDRRSATTYYKQRSFVITFTVTGLEEVIRSRKSVTFFFGVVLRRSISDVYSNWFDPSGGVLVQAPARRGGGPVKASPVSLEVAFKLSTSTGEK